MSWEEYWAKYPKELERYRKVWLQALLAWVFVLLVVTAALVVWWML